MTDMLNTATENVRWLAAWGRQERGVDQRAAGPRKIGSVGIVGAGVMGTAIAAAHVQYRLPVVIHDGNAAVLGRAAAAIAAELRKADSHLTPGYFRRLVRPTADLAEVARCDLVLESIVETLPAKMQLYAQLQAAFGPADDPRFEYFHDSAATSGPRTGRRVAILRFALLPSGARAAAGRDRLRPPDQRRYDCRGRGPRPKNRSDADGRAGRAGVRGQSIAVSLSERSVGAVAGRRAGGVHRTGRG